MARIEKSKRTLPTPPPLPTPPHNRLACVFKDPPRKHVLLLSCMDQRLLDETVRFMNGLNLHNRYDQVALAGAAMGVNNLPEGETDPSRTWFKLFTDHLSTAINELDRQIKDVFLLDHLDCGAYRVFHPDHKIRKEYPKATLERMRELHEVQLVALTLRVHEFCESQHKEFCKAQPKKTKAEAEKESPKEGPWENIRVSCFIVDLRGEVTQLGD